ncbi:MAG: Slp family lipoprotein [Nitrospira sp.]|nr:MAG: Slp family lipoprotein [Nitrospira sp.]
MAMRRTCAILPLLLRQTRASLPARAVLSLIALLVMLAGCASTQEADERQGLNFLQVKAAPDSFQGQPAIFGGKVLTARRQKDGTKIEILQLPLDRSMRPGYDLTQSQGRFIAIYREFLDPATIPPGTRVTVTGQVSGSVTQPLDETEYTYPVLTINRVQVWSAAENVAPRIRPYPYMGPSPYWGPYWGPWPYYW